MVFELSNTVLLLLNCTVNLGVAATLKRGSSLENYTFLTRTQPYQKANVFGVSREPILEGFSNTGNFWRLTAD